MSTQKDPLIQPQSPDRVYYATGALLDKDDFFCEQTYHRARLARLLAYLHGPGTVAGLDVPPISDEDEIVRVTPGLAVDRLGRLIEVPRPACLRIDPWFQAKLDEPENYSQMENNLHAGSLGELYVVTDLFIKFVVCERGKQPAFATGNFDALDAVAPSRLRDSYRIDLVIREEDEPPVPNRGFPDLSGMSPEEMRERVMQYKLQEAWKESTAWTGFGETLELLPEHVKGQDGTELLLARLWIPVKWTMDSTPLLERDPDFSIQVDNTLRQFTFSTAELVWLTGIM